MGSQPGRHANSARAFERVQSTDGTVHHENWRYGLAGRGYVPSVENHQATSLGSAWFHPTSISNRPKSRSQGRAERSDPDSLTALLSSAPTFLAFIHPSKNESVSTRHRTLDDDATFPIAARCGNCLPSRSTFSRTLHEMTRFSELVENATVELVRESKKLIPELEREVPKDSTPVASNSDLNFELPSDP